MIDFKVHLTFTPKKHQTKWLFASHGIFNAIIKTLKKTTSQNTCVFVITTLHGWGSTPYVSSLWAFWRKFISDVSGLWPLREKNKMSVDWLLTQTTINSLIVLNFYSISSSFGSRFVWIFDEWAECLLCQTERKYFPITLSSYGVYVLGWSFPKMASDTTFSCDDTWVWGAASWMFQFLSKKIE